MRWILLDVAVVLVALGVLAVVVRVLLRAVKALGRTVGAAGLRVTEVVGDAGALGAIEGQHPPAAHR